MNTICTGMAASMASVLLFAGHERVILPYANILIHKLLVDVQGQDSDILIAAKQINKCRKECRMNPKISNNNVKNRLKCRACIGLSRIIR